MPKTFEYYIDKMLQIRAAKGHDYGDNKDTYANCRRCEEFGVPAWKGVLIRMSDKFQRLVSFTKNGEFKVSDESFEDTLVDLANYAIICAVLKSETELTLSGGGATECKVRPFSENKLRNFTSTFNEALQAAVTPSDEK